MAKKLTFILLILVLASPVFAGENDGLMSYATFLERRGLENSNIEEKNCVTEDVLNTRIRDWDSARTVCELWMKERPGHPLKYNDGSQVYRTAREWIEEVVKPDRQPRTGLFMVKQDEKADPQPAKVTSFKRYVTTGND